MFTALIVLTRFILSLEEKIMNKNSKTLLTTHGEIMRPFCSVCSCMMDEIGIDEEVVYLCACGASRDPVFIYTTVDDYSGLMADIDELIDVKIQLAELNIRETNLKNGLLDRMKHHGIINRRDVEIRYQSYDRQSVKWKAASNYIRSKYGEKVLNDIIESCRTNSKCTGIRVSLGSKIKADCDKRARMKRSEKVSQVIPKNDLWSKYKNLAA